MSHRFAFVCVISALLAGCGGGTVAVTAASPSTQSSGGTSATEATEATVHLQVRNASDHEICYLYISHVSDPHWGPDLLGSRTLATGETDAYEMPAGSWDIKADDCAHGELFVMHAATIDEHSVLTLHN